MVRAQCDQHGRAFHLADVQRQPEHGGFHLVGVDDDVGGFLVCARQPLQQDDRHHHDQHDHQPQQGQA